MKRFRVGGEDEEDCINLANVLMLLSRGSSFAGGEAGHGPVQPPGRVFECKTCSRRFSSFQALGGHRASHKKPRLGEHGLAAQQTPAPARPRVHECSVCGLEFPIGQALGGHMRRHRAAAAATEVLRQALTEGKPAGGGKRGGTLCLDLDLNFSPAEEDVEFDLGLGLPMVDCFH